MSNARVLSCRLSLLASVAALTSRGPDFPKSENANRFRVRYSWIASISIMMADKRVAIITDASLRAGTWQQKTKC
ncbi:hypothetical protein EV126DRAFT_426663 [Verticillium dahliae]|nr:hypothetical protein EV126DRAFT_426663 [Verticillium dahliae]